MPSPTIWTAGRYDAVGQRIAPIAEQVLDAVEKRRPLRDATLVDLACGTSVRRRPVGRAQRRPPHAPAECGLDVGAEECDHPSLV